jgi:hypothetical protein
VDWGPLLVGIGAILTPLTAVLIAVLRLSRENRRQHDENKEAANRRFDELRGDVANMGSHVDRKIDRLEDRFTERMDRHENIHHRGRRRW